MGKSSVVTKEIRAEIQARKRRIHGDPSTRKLKIRTQPVAISGKRKRKLFKKWRRDQKDKIEKGLITMQDVEMAVVQGSSEINSNERSNLKLNMKKKPKLRIRELKRQGKKNGKNSTIKSSSAADNPLVDVMLE
ncbi:hypothetical protein ZOSMA_26G01100 [Zostera marina]|uniref:Uncharacterized protein n=1 Tax=Zostera marina TaxID=29655 RepID=A0A0K9PGK7_ZOSMR|nr:hypothetical protein ZOSMA_26G01100 [Zostera marina]